MSLHLECGNEENFYLWKNHCQYWCEGVLLITVGSVGFIGNFVTILILSTK